MSRDLTHFSAHKLVVVSFEQPHLMTFYSIQGFTGDRCDKKASECSMSPCSNGATCSDDPLRDTGYRCFCPTVSSNALITRFFLNFIHVITLTNHVTECFLAGLPWCKMRYRHVQVRRWFGML